IGPGQTQFKINVTEQLQWYVPGTPMAGDYDIVIVQDTSQSMGYCWDINQNCQPGVRRVDYGTSFVRAFVHELLVNRASMGLTSRLAYITYGPQEHGASARLRVPLSGSSLAAYEALVGSTGNPRTIPAAEVTGYTNTAAALKLAQQELANARTVDQNGKPVKQAIILISDGTADVLFDAPYAGTPNRYDAAPFYCGDSADDINNPLVQSSCPRGPAYNEPRSPIGAAVGVADEIRANTNAAIYSIVAGEPYGSTPVERKFHEISPDRYYMLNNPAQLETMLNTLEIELGEPCQELWDNIRPAAGAQVTIKTQTGQLVHQGVLNADGSRTLGLWPGTFTISVAHNGAVAPQDPLQIPRNYTRLIAGGSGPVSSITYTVGSYGSMQLDAHLAIDNPVNAKCPE
ncbi:MAG TPA: VWA domain-containing protein, partial [Herpetosiphonaceae bacterium]|nr:VWA domain-containing protein [Herpetosiphonaceae bacterium]